MERTLTLPGPVDHRIPYYVCLHAASLHAVLYCLLSIPSSTPSPHLPHMHVLLQACCRYCRVVVRSWSPWPTPTWPLPLVRLL